MNCCQNVSLQSSVGSFAKDFFVVEVELVRFPFENHAGWDERPIQAIVNASMESWIDVIPSQKVESPERL